MLHNLDLTHCDVLLQDCSEPGQARYANTFTGEELCAAPAIGAGTGEQGDPCDFQNGCAEGYGCSLLNDTQDGLLCAFYCDPDTLDGPSCDDGPGTGFDCVRINEYWAADPVRDEVGMCLPAGTWP